VIRMFHCLFIVFKIPLFSMPSSDQNVPLSFHCFRNTSVLLISSRVLWHDHDTCTKLFITRG
jgi:hypothetical protein